MLARSLLNTLTALIANRLRASFPGHSVIGEEASAHDGRIPALGDEPTWIVDPVDGTQNLVHGLPISAVSIGLCRGGVPVLGVVYDPHRDELFVAAAGRGAFLNGRPIRVEGDAGEEGKGATAGTPLPCAMVLTDPGYERSCRGIDRLEGMYGALLRTNVRAVRMIGSTVLCLAWIACGRASAYVAGMCDKDCPKPWDWCAGSVLVMEAGGCLGLLEGRLYDGSGGGGNGSGSGGARGSGGGGGGDSALPFHVYAKGGIASSNQGLLEDLRETMIAGAREGKMRSRGGSGGGGGAGGVGGARGTSTPATPIVVDMSPSPGSLAGQTTPGPPTSGPPSPGPPTTHPSPS